ncbi:MAG: type II toxin-antitoxin system RelE family toxin [Thermoanaerobaculia bacterium]
MAYRIFETRQFQRDMEALGPDVCDRLEKKLRSHVYPHLVESPRFGPNVKRLQGFDPPTWRYRIGDWRFFFSIDDGKQIVSMLAADHRSRAYR